MKPILSWITTCLLLALTAPWTDSLGQGNSYVLVLNKGDDALLILDGQTYKSVAQIPVGVGPHEVIASADGKFAYVGNYGTAQVLGNSLSVIDLGAKKEVRRVDLGPLKRPHGLVEINGKILFTCEVNRAIARYDPLIDKVDWVMGIGQDAAHMIVGNAEQKKLFTANIASGSVSLFDFSTSRTELLHIPVGGKPEGIDISPDGKEVWVAHRGAGTVAILDTAAKKVSETIKVGGDPYRVRFTPDGKRVLISDPQASELVVFDTTMRKEIKRIAIEGVAAGITTSADSKRAFVTRLQGNGIAVIDLDALTVTTNIETGRSPDGVAWVGK